MTWKRVATAAVLMPVVIALVVWGSTVMVAVAVAVLTAVALWEYFALGEAIGHRGYRVWTVICAVLLVFVQLRAAREWDCHDIGPCRILRIFREGRGLNS